MRQYAFLKEPLRRGEGCVYKIMLYTDGDGVCLFEYPGPDAVLCSSDLWYESPEALHGEWDGLIDERGWIDIGDPLPDCQHDAFLPVRVKGRDTGAPEWGKYEILRGGEWAAYEPV